MNHSLAAAWAASSVALLFLLTPISLSAEIHASPAVHGQGEGEGTDLKPTPLETSSCHVLAGQKAAIVTTRSGLVRRVELEGLGATAEAREHEGTGRPPLVKEIDGGRIVTLDSEGAGYLRSSETLEPLGRFAVGPGRGPTAIAPTGKCIARVIRRSEVAIGTLSESPGDPVVLECESPIKDLAYSPDGSRLVALVERGYRVIERGKLGELVPLPAAMEPRLVEFIGHDKLAFGSGNGHVEAPVEVLIVDARTGAQKRVITAPFQAAPLGGFVSTLKFHPDCGRLVFGISSAGSVLAVDPDSGELHWHIDFHGGNPGGIGVVHARGSGRCFSHGMTDLHRAAFHWDTGQRLSGDRLHGYNYLCGTSDDSITVGIQAGRLIRLDSETYEPEMRRIEHPGPLAGSVGVFSRPR